MTASELLTKDGHIVCIQVYIEGVFVKGGLRKHPLRQQTATLLIISPPSALARYHLDTDPAWEERDLIWWQLTLPEYFVSGLDFILLLFYVDILLFSPMLFWLLFAARKLSLIFGNHISQKWYFRSFHPAEMSFFEATMNGTLCRVTNNWGIIRAVYCARWCMKRLASAGHSGLASSRHNLMTRWPGVSSNRGIGSIMTGPEDEGWERELGPWITDHKGQLMAPGAAHWGCNC